MDQTRIRVSLDPFSVGDEYQWLVGCHEDGAVVTFAGKVRDHNLGGQRNVAHAGALSGHDGKSAG